MKDSPKTNINGNLNALQSLAKERGLDLVYVSSADPFLNEYTPLANCLRYYVTNFTGSVAEVLVPAEGRVKLFVDGRYHEQAHLEVDESIIEVIEVPSGTSLKTALLEVLDKANQPSLGIIPTRTQVSYYSEFLTKTKVSLIQEADVTDQWDYHPLIMEGETWVVPQAFSEKALRDKTSEMVGEGEAYFVTALDSVAWLTSTRGDYLPFQATFPAKAIITSNNVRAYSFDGVKGSRHEEGIEWQNENKIESDLKALCSSGEIKKFKVDSLFLNTQDYLALVELVGEDNIEFSNLGLNQYQAFKTEEEIQGFEKSFEQSDQAIFNTIKWAKDNGIKKESSDELAFYDKASAEYKNVGARFLSFNTIAAFGANSSIIHFGASSKENKLVPGELALLDSGGFYDWGLATDCTRTVLMGKEAQSWQKEIYTGVLKGLIAVLKHSFEPGTGGVELDEMARAPMREMGFDFAHCTGHGVGVNVHERGYSISKNTTVGLQEGMVGSVEPGIYIPGKGGVRLENVVSVVKDEKNPGKLRFHNFVYIGFDHDLIDDTLLSKSEKEWLEEYENECHKRGRSFLAAPLLSNKTSSNPSAKLDHQGSF